MFPGMSFNNDQLSDIRDKQKSSSKQYREKQKVLQQEKNMLFEEVTNENFNLKAENTVLRREIDGKFNQITGQIQLLTTEIQKLVSSLSGQSYVPPQTNQYQQQQQQIEQPNFEVYEDDTCSPPYISDLSNHGLLFAFVLFIVFVIPKLFVPSASNGFKMQPKFMNYFSQQQNTFNVETVKTAFQGAEGSAENESKNGLKVFGFNVFDVAQFCQDVCKGQVE
ncbi:Conserved_hypothetical protein [Hexamita inflata]|uniref:Uncharacterized protein n=1 Tax=Hexamita inflata TaxID=28002 RepID=A0AA86UCS6_9EUKA|nr:Conserved hypothetical protein [Hexamita inflata]